MAEGDTILRTARQLDPVLTGRAVRARAPNPRGRAAGVERLDGRTVGEVRAHGKHLVLDFGELALHSHLGMNGSWRVYAPEQRWGKPARSAWLALETDAGEAVQFGGPTLRVLTAGALRRDPQLSRLGPDVLAPDFDPEAAIELLHAGPERGLGDALLDQTLVAGIGNIFKGEACFAAGVSPWRPVGELGDEELRAVLSAARELMLTAVANGRPPRAVYRRAGQPCPGCGARIESRGQGDDNRTTYWCPSCQHG